MKKILFYTFVLFSLSIFGQAEKFKRQVDLLTIEKTQRHFNWNIYWSGNKRIQAKCCSDFDGIDIFLNPQDIVDNTIYMKFYENKPFKRSL
jgi:hypothetical protein